MTSPNKIIPEGLNIHIAHDDFHRNHLHHIIHEPSLLSHFPPYRTPYDHNKQHKERTEASKGNLDQGSIVVNRPINLSLQDILYRLRRIRQIVRC